MSLKINYLDRKKSLSKNTAIFVNSNIKTSGFKGKFDHEISQKIQNIIKKNKNSKDNKIILLNQDLDQRLIIIYLSKVNGELDSEKMGAKFFDFVKNNEVNDIYIKAPIFESSKKKYNINYNSFNEDSSLANELPEFRATRSWPIASKRFCVLVFRSRLFVSGTFFLSSANCSAI